MAQYNSKNNNEKWQIHLLLVIEMDPWDTIFQAFYRRVPE